MFSARSSMTPGRPGGVHTRPGQRRHATRRGTTHRKQRLEFNLANPQRASVRIALSVPTKGEYTLAYSIVSNDGSIRRLDQRTTDEFVFVGEKL